MGYSIWRLECKKLGLELGLADRPVLPATPEVESQDLMFKGSLGNFETLTQNEK